MRAAPHTPESTIARDVGERDAGGGATGVRDAGGAGGECAGGKCADSTPAATRAPSDQGPFARADVVHELSLLRLAAAEAFERGVPKLLEALARDVLARELLLAPPDIAALAERALTEFAEHEPVAIVVAPCDLQCVGASLPVRGDAELRTGDLVIEVRDGAFESHFRLRFEAALEDALAAA